MIAIMNLPKLMDDNKELLLGTAAQIKRPMNPPPPAPGSRLSNGRSTESLTSTCDLEATILGHNPVPPPRKVNITKLCHLCTLN